MNRICERDNCERDNPQASLWNGPAGLAWVQAQAMLDAVFAPIQALLVESIGTVEVDPAARVLDVGCGTGSTTLAIARRLGPRATCVGVDISGPMIEAARERAQAEGARVRFIQADAQRHPFPTTGFDVVASRFGVMFFDDPEQAFANLHRAARSGAALQCVTWRGAEENPFMVTAERAAAPLLPGLPPRVPGAPGQFAFAQAAPVRALLERSGWTDVDIEPIDVPCTLPESALIPWLGCLGPVGLRLRDVDARTRARVIDTVRAAFEPFVQGDEVRFDAACWMTRANARQAGG